MNILAFTNARSCLLAIATVFAVFANILVAHSQPRPSSYEGWKTDFDKFSIDLGEIMSGGPPKDGIPSIDKPKFVAVSKADKYTDREPVIGLEFKGEARAYPLSVLMWHEIANDVIGGHAVAVTFCPLCNAAIVFDAMIDGKPHQFGTTGRLRNSDLLMYDRVTESWWQQFSGEAIIGDYLGRKMKILPSRLESFANFKKRFPNGKVLVPDNPGRRDYGRNPYVNYDTSATPFLYSGSMPEGISPMARVVVIRDVSGPIIVAMEKVRGAGGIELSGYQFSWKEGQASALDSGRISEGREIGNIIVSKMQDSKMRDVAYDVTFAFVAHAFHPEVKILQ